MRVLIDTCVIVDVLQDRRPFSASAKDLLFAIEDGAIEGFITAAAITDIYYIMHKFFHDDHTCRKLIKQLTSFIGILDTSSGDCLRALSSEMRDFEDAVMAETAMSNRMDYIATRNVRDYGRSQVRALTPVEILGIVTN